MANNSVAKLAQHLASHGRHGDSVLVHMQPKEVEILSRLAGKPPTINPVTGLPEAFSWGKLLAGIGGVLGAPFTGGLSLAILPALAASSLIGGQKKEEGPEATEGSKYLAARAQKAKEGYQIPLVQLQALQHQPGYIPGVMPEQNIAPIRKPVGYVSPGGQAFSQIPPGFAEGGQVPEQNEAALLMQVMKQAISQGNVPQELAAKFIQVFGQDRLMLLMQEAQMGAQQQPMGPGPEEGMARGGQLKGPGGGMDDLLRARVNGGQEVALAGDEFVVPADAVAHLGDGSSDAGSRALEALVARVRMAKTGSRKQPGKINLRRVMGV